MVGQVWQLENEAYGKSDVWLLGCTCWIFQSMGRLDPEEGGFREFKYGCCFCVKCGTKAVVLGKGDGGP